MIEVTCQNCHTLLAIIECDDEEWILKWAERVADEYARRDHVIRLRDDKS